MPSNATVIICRITRLARPSGPHSARAPDTRDVKISVTFLETGITVEPIFRSYGQISRSSDVKNVKIPHNSPTRLCPVSRDNIFNCHYNIGGRHNLKESGLSLIHI